MLCYILYCFQVIAVAKSSDLVLMVLDASKVTS
jgi:ribosome-interacting GTPase 1